MSLRVLNTKIVYFLLRIAKRIKNFTNFVQPLGPPNPYTKNVKNQKLNHMAKDNDWKSRLQVVYSTNPDYNYVTDEEPEMETLPKPQQKLRVQMEKNHRGGKTVTIVRGFVGTDDDLKALAKLLKTRCGVGGSAKEGEIIIQGDFKPKVVELLIKEGYTGTK